MAGLVSATTMETFAAAVHLTESILRQAMPAISEYRHLNGPSRHVCQVALLAVGPWRQVTGSGRSFTVCNRDALLIT